MCIRRLGGRRSQEMRFTRFLRNAAVSVAEIAGHAAGLTAGRVAGRDILAIQDTSELVVGGRKARAQGFGAVGRGGQLSGLLLHPVLAVDASSGALVGLADLAVWNRSAGKVLARRQRATQQKESQRWIAGAERAGAVLAAAARITVVADRESDIYELFARRPEHVGLIVRAAQNRSIEDGTRLFAHVDGLPENGRVGSLIPAAPGRAERQAVLALRYGAVQLRKPRHGAAKDLPTCLPVMIVDVRELDPPPGVPAVHWRLLTTDPVASLEQAREVLDRYRRRWIVERYFHTTKSGGFDIEAAEIGEPDALSRLVAAVAVAAVSVMQLVQARDGNTQQLLSDVFAPEDPPLLQALSRQLEGATARQKNPHPAGTLAFAAWVIARLGGWTGYYGKPGPVVMRRGLHDFQRIKHGATLRLAIA